MPEKHVLREKRRCCLLVSYRPLAKAQSTAAKFYATNSVGQATEAVLGLALYRRSRCQHLALRVGTLASPSWLSHACIGLQRLQGAVDAATKLRRRRGAKTPSTLRRLIK